MAAKAKQAINKTEEVNAYMDRLDHPLKAEAQAVRDIIKGVNRDITEQIKWNAPTFSYKGYLVTFNFYEKDHLRLVFHNGAILDQQNGFLEGSYPDRRLVSFAGMADVNAKRAALENAVREWVQRMDAQAGDG